MNPRVARDVNTYDGTSNAADVPAHPAGYRTDPTVTPTANTSPHWAFGIGGVLDDPRTVTIHGTSGWATYASAINSGQLMKSLGGEWRFSHGQWYDGRGVGPQYTIDPNGTIFPIIGPEDLDGDARVTYHNEAMNPCSIGVEQADFGDNGHVVLDAPGSTLLYRLNTSPGVTATTEDLAGLKLYALLHPGRAEDVVLVWIALSAYDGPGDITNRHFSGWRNSLFTERDYRSLVTLCRFLSERHRIPRNLPTLPYAMRSIDHTNEAIFRQLLLGDPICDQIASRLGLDVSVVRAGGDPWSAVYHATDAKPFQLWTGFFGLPTRTGGHARTPCFQGFISHWINGGHPCPGPFFDWHRFARELWDFWWYPFDFSGTPAQPATASRAYRQARGNTRLTEYYFDAVGTTADYRARMTLQAPPPGDGEYELFGIPAQTPVYALANGVVVAARLPGTSTGDPGNGFLLTRHEVFTANASGEVSFDTPPKPVWSLIRYLAAPGFRVDQIGRMNPDWLNRLVMRLRECELAVAYHTAHPTLDRLTRGWRHHPMALGDVTPPTTLPTVGEAIERDAAAYRELADALLAGDVVLFPREVGGAATSVRAILGDFVGTPDFAPGGSTGIQVEIFSKVELSVPGRIRQVVSAKDEPWWAGVSAAARHEARAEQDLPADGTVWAYPMTSFLEWIDGVTWRHEWSKYGIIDDTGEIPGPAAAPARPNSRTSF